MNEGRLIFKDPDELIHFLREFTNFLRESGIALEDDANYDNEDDGGNDGEGQEVVVDSASAEAGKITAEVTQQEPTAPGGPARMFAKVNIPEGSPVANQVAALIKDIYGEDTEISFNASAPTIGYYDPERRLYHFGDEVYGEHAVIWFPVPPGNYLDITYDYDPDNQEQPIIVPLDTTNLNRHQPRIALEKDYQAAFELAKTKDEPGTVAICYDGKFCIPCTGFYNPNDDITEYLINVFNVKSCETSSKNLWTMLILQVGNITETMPFKFAKGTEIDWQAVLDYLLEHANTSEYEQPQVKLFDEFEDSMIKREPSTLQPAPLVQPAQSAEATTLHHSKNTKKKQSKKSPDNTSSAKKSKKSKEPGA